MNTAATEKAASRHLRYASGEMPRGMSFQMQDGSEYQVLQSGAFYCPAKDRRSVKLRKRQRREAREQ
jgi:hypothetical protein